MTDVKRQVGERFQILSLDGGGIKGILSAGILAKLEDDLDIRVADHFDLIAGTSTGGIIALGLGMGLTPRQVLEFYLQEGPRIFPSRFGFRNILHWFSSKYSAEPLVDALKTCFGERQLGESSKRLLIPAYNLTDDDVYIFRTAHLPHLNRDYKVPAWQVARATSAAPTYLPCTRDVDSLRLVDGGVWANNPAMVALVEAAGAKNLGIPLQDIHMLSIGTSNALRNRKKRLDEGGIVSWARGEDAVSIIMRGQSIGANNQVKFLLGDQFTRIDPSVPDGKFSLDGTKTVDELVAMAAHHSRAFAPLFTRNFYPHRAAQFEAHRKLPCT